MRKISLGSFLLLSLFGCHQAQIKVLDEDNHPLAGARVFTMSPSTQSEPGLTDADGIATLEHIAGGNMLRIELAGFDTIFANLNPKPPTLVVLKKSPPAPSP
jgi:hypothetical protein